MATEVWLERKKKEKGTYEQLRWRNGIGTSQTGEEKPLTAIWYRVLSLMRREAILIHRGTDQSHHTWTNNLIWAFNRGICQQLVIWSRTTAPEDKKKKKLFTWRVPKSNTWQWADKHSSRKRNQQGIWSLNCCLKKKKKKQKKQSLLCDIDFTVSV